MMVWPPEVFEMVGGYYFTTIGVIRACCEWHGDDDRLTIVTAVWQWLLRAGGWVDQTHRLRIVWRNAWSMKLRVQGQEEDQRGPGEVVREDSQARKLNKEDAIDRCKWRKLIKDVQWSGRVWVGECFFWYRHTRVVPDKRPLNGCMCVCMSPKTIFRKSALSLCLSTLTFLH